VRRLRAFAAIRQKSGHDGVPFCRSLRDRRRQSERPAFRHCTAGWETPGSLRDKRKGLRERIAPDFRFCDGRRPDAFVTAP
jgi:hypothetical protein